MDDVSVSEKIPVVVLAGFLGAGKTTILNHLLRQSNGRKIGVVVNDFGEVNIDSLLVGKQTESTMELSGGCICCQMSDGGLDETLEGFAHPGSTIDVIVIEASGIAEPTDLRKLILYSSNKMIDLGGVVYVVDVVNISSLIDKHPEIKEHIASADLLVLTKTDVATDKQITNAKAILTGLNPTAPSVTADHGKIAPELLFDQTVTENEQLSLASDAHDHTHLHSQFISVDFSTERPLSPKRFDAFLSNLPPEVYRLKAILYYGMKGFEQKVIVHKVGRHTSQSAEEWKGYETPSSHIVAIGADIDKAKLASKMKDCIDPAPEDLKSDDMIDIMRLKGF